MMAPLERPVAAEPPSPAGASVVASVVVVVVVVTARSLLLDCGRPRVIEPCAAGRPSPAGARVRSRASSRQNPATAPALVGSAAARSSDAGGVPAAARVSSGGRNV